MKAINSAPPPETREMVAYADLLDRAHGEGLKSLQTQIVAQPSEENGRRCIVKAIVETEKGHFEGIGDADPGNVEDFLVPHLIRVAETRAKARALRDAVNCGVVSFEELDGVRLDRTSSPGPGATNSPPAHQRSNGSANRGTPPRSARRETSNGPMSDAQRRYLFRLLAGRGLPGARGEAYLKEHLGVERLSQATRADASALIDELVQSSAPARGSNGAAQPHHQY